MRTSKKSKIIVYTILIIMAVLFFLPFLWMILASFDTNATLAIKIPKVTFQNYKHVLINPKMLLSFWNGFIIAFGQSVIVVVFSILAAYPLSRYNFKHKQTFMFSLLFLVGMPILAVMVPVYQLFFYLHFTNSLIATTVFMASTAFPFAIWLMKSFMDSIPVELEESAWIDGGGLLTGLRKIIVPLMIPGIFVVFIFVFTGGWGNFMVPFILLNSPDKMPPAVTIYQFFSQYGFINYGRLAAFATLYTIPPIVFYVIGQRYMSEGFKMSGSSK